MIGYSVRAQAKESLGGHEQSKQSKARCVTCSGQKCRHVNFYMEANEDPVVERKSERQKKLAKSVKTTAVVGDPKLLMEPREEGGDSADEEHDEKGMSIEGRNIIIHHSQDTKDSRSSSMVLYVLSTEGNIVISRSHSHFYTLLLKNIYSYPEFMW